jgi:two-component system OmpR family response regulator
MLYDSHAQKVLVVEDDPMMLELICTRLDLAGYRTINARNGLEGLERLRDGRPNAMVLDISMPGLDGFGVLQEMKLIGNKTPTMVLTARNQTADVQKAIQLGARDFLTKPFEDRLLLTRVARLIRPPQARPAGAPTQAPAARSQMI